jgi:hypothetical protein
MAGTKRRLQEQKPAPSRAGSSNKKEKERPLSSWISSLAKGTTDASTTTNKAGRIEKREAKKRRREDRKATSGQSLPKKAVEDGMKVIKKKSVKERMKDTLMALAIHIEETVAARMEQDERPVPFDNSIVKKKGMNKKRKWEDDTIQPRNRDYGGIGLARPSMFLPLNDPSFVPKLEQEFAEHVPGFFGKTHTKAVKKQKDGGMLWRKMADKKTQQTKVNGKKLADMSADERVEAMIKAGMV